MSTEAAENAWFDGRTKAQALLERLEESFDKLGERPPALRELRRRFVEIDPFRIVFVGQFNTGKSSLISALAGIPELAPSAMVACTDAIVEYAHGPHPTYLRGVGGRARKWEEIDRDTFIRETSVPDEPDAGPEESRPRVLVARHYRVDATSAYLKPMKLVLVDTPGFGEDDFRSRIAEEQAKGAVAAVMVISGTTAGSKLELDLIQRLAEERVALMLVLTWADQVGKDRERILRRLNDSLAKRGIKIDPQRVIFTSAKRELDALSARSPSDGDPGIAELREAIVSQVARTAGRQFLDAVLANAAELRAAGLKSADSRRRGLEEGQVQATEREVEALATQIEKARIAMLSVIKRVRSPTATVQQLDNQFHSMLEDLLSTLPDSAAGESTKASPLDFKALAEELLGRLLERVDERAKEWASAAATEIVTQELNSLMESAARDLEAFDWLQETMGSGHARNAHQIIDAAIGRLLGRDATGAAWAGGAAAAAAAIGALLAGYVFADGLLYYALGAAVGFLNPAILGAAIVGAAALMVVGGPHLIRKAIAKELVGHIRREILHRRNETRDAMTNAIGPIHADIARALEDELIGALADARQRLALRTNHLALAKRGDLEALGAEVREAARLQAELEQLFVELDAALSQMKRGLDAA